MDRGGGGGGKRGGRDQGGSSRVASAGESFSESSITREPYESESAVSRGRTATSVATSGTQCSCLDQKI